eukprot:CAMPEP_0206565816 /NCGR_PEP_ID=MMETSP0325_2-20121206/24302_1 /ASSEMBLY_ACC=CAM_ASM_000347 /TAXON_ID=2866 /ORGANISM="Crypthecodinium cohnii, Strain Seligo" /LENGTH=214 /DNA_ID=CAMNT_0054068755 /DNA_START=40 /DNA_END=681 /DNA_ORIENTATION=-
MAWRASLALPRDTIGLAGARTGKQLSSRRVLRWSWGHGGKSTASNLGSSSCPTILRVIAERVVVVDVVAAIAAVVAVVVVVAAAAATGALLDCIAVAPGSTHENARVVTAGGSLGCPRAVFVTCATVLYGHAAVLRGGGRRGGRPNAGGIETWRGKEGDPHDFLGLVLLLEAVFESKFALYFDAVEVVEAWDMDWVNGTSSDGTGYFSTWVFSV